MKKIKKKAGRLLLGLLMGFAAGILCFPVLVVISGSFMSNTELAWHLKPVMNQTEAFISWSGIPDYPTLKHYLRLLFYMPEFHKVYGNSVKLIVCILAGQMVTAVPAAWAFAVFRFRLRRLLFLIYVILMLIPFQVTMLSSYLVLDAFYFMDTHLAIIIPAIFSTFPVFLIYRSFRGVPESILDAARMDGAGELQIYLYIGLPLGSAGVLSSLVLGFLEYWNMIEQPLAFLRSQTLWPLSLYLPNIGIEQAGYAFAASVLVLIPSVLVFLLGRDFLEQGIMASATK